MAACPGRCRGEGPMTEVPEHLLRRSRERRKALGLPVPGEEGGEEAAEAAPEAPAAEATEPAAEAPAGAPAGGSADDTAAAAAASGVPPHLPERSQRRPRQLAGQGGARAAAAAATTGGGATATATAPKPTPTATGPGGHTQRLLTVVKSGSIQQTRAEAQDKVHVWPHLLVIEFAAVLVVTAGLLIFSAV